MKQRIITSVIVLSLLATIPAWGQTSVIRRESPKKSPRTSEGPFIYKEFRCWIMSDLKSVKVEARNKEKLKGSVTIPSEVIWNGKKYPVKGILDEAFDASNITSVHIPGSVRIIGNLAFGNCKSLEDIEIPNGVEELESYVFLGCKGLKTVKISDSVVKIGNDILRDRENLAMPVFNSKLFVRMIKSYEGYYELPDGIEEICYGAFNGCHGLSSVYIHDSIKRIGGYAFIACSSLESVSIPSSVLDSIGYRAFGECPKLRTITIRYPDGRTENRPIKDKWKGNF